MSLHDQLLADLEDLDDEGDVAQEELAEDAEMDDADEELQDAADILASDDHKSVTAVAKLGNSEKLRRVLAAIEAQADQADQVLVGAVEHDPTYKLIVEANNLTAEINSEIGIVHKFLRDNYAKRFSELEQLVQDPIDYARTVKLLGNDLDVAQPAINETLPPATVMVISVTASTTQGEQLTEEELARVMEAADLALHLDSAKQRIFDYVESKMYFLAPNLAHICGATIAAKLLGAAGGLTALSKMPADVIQLLGAKKTVSSGFSAANTLPHTGFVYYSDVVQEYPPEYRRKAARLVSTKIALAARVDSYREAGVTGATVGLSLREEIDKKMDKALEPPPAKAIKALPRPDDPKRKKRGGKRFRRQRERMQMSEAQKAAMRMKFGELQEDEFQEDAPKGKIGVAEGRVRTVEAKMKGGLITKRTKKQMEMQAKLAGGASTIRAPTTAGTASVSFTPLQGLEIVAPHAKEESKAAGKYIGSTQFRNVQKASG